MTDTIVGADAGLREVMERIDQVAPTDVPVLILGETGSGKEVLARAIHNRSRRARGPVRPRQLRRLAARPDRLGAVRPRARELHRRDQPRKGWFERADGGTLFLDEVGELPLDAQVRLLRVLQDGTLRARRRSQVAQGRRPRSSPPPIATSQAMVAAGDVPRGSLVSPQRLPDRAAAAARAARGHPARWRRISPAAPASAWAAHR